MAIKTTTGGLMEFDNSRQTTRELTKEEKAEIEKAYQDYSLRLEREGRVRLKKEEKKRKKEELKQKYDKIWRWIIVAILICIIIYLFA